MSFQPAIPLTGYSGWQFLRRTQAAQESAFRRTPEIQNDLEYFRNTIGSIRSADQLVNDRRLLSVALGAFGLDGDINNRFFIQKILEDGTLDPSSLANRLSDKRYLEFSRAFGFGDIGAPRTQNRTFSSEIAQSYQTRQFERAVGNQDNDLRLAMEAERTLPDIAQRDISNNAMWFTVMGNKPLRTVFETAFGLPESFGALDLDRQLDEFQARSQQVLGTSELSDIGSPGTLDELIRTFLVRREASTFSPQISAAQTALTLLQSY